MDTTKNYTSTVFEYIKGKSEGGRFSTSYQAELIPGEITDDGYCRVIGHFETEEERLSNCSCPRNNLEFAKQMSGFSLMEAYMQAGMMDEYLEMMRER